jgi:hypothetical protein
VNVPVGFNWNARSLTCRQDCQYMIWLQTVSLCCLLLSIHSCLENSISFAINVVRKNKQQLFEKPSPPTRWLWVKWSFFRRQIDFFSVCGKTCSYVKELLVNADFIHHDTMSRLTCTEVTFELKLDIVAATIFCLLSFLRRKWLAYEITSLLWVPPPPPVS